MNYELRLCKGKSQIEWCSFQETTDLNLCLIPFEMYEVPAEAHYFISTVAKKINWSPIGQHRYFRTFYWEMFKQTFLKLAHLCHLRFLNYQAINLAKFNVYVTIDLHSILSPALHLLPHHYRSLCMIQS